jgi:hypothetical protein
VAVICRGLNCVIRQACPDAKMSAEKKAEYGDTTQYLDEITLFQMAKIACDSITQAFDRREKAILATEKQREGAADLEEGDRLNEWEEETEEHDCCLALVELLGKNFFRIFRHGKRLETPERLILEEAKLLVLTALVVVVTTQLCGTTFRFPIATERKVCW